MTEPKPMQFLILKYLSNGSKSRTGIYKAIIKSLNDDDISLQSIYRHIPELIKEGYIKTILSPKFGDKKNRVYYRITKKGKYRFRLKYLEDHIEYYEDVKQLTIVGLK